VMNFTEGIYLENDSETVLDYPLTAALGVQGAFFNADQPDIGEPGEDYGVAVGNLRSGSIAAMIRVVYSPGEQAAANSLLRVVQNSIQLADAE
ncbi:MAG: hypothetical protein AAF125_06275, partial [Chloroflexota bacterium]